MISYICDRRACESCSDECSRTTNIEHAKHFEKRGDAFVEVGPKPLIFQMKSLVSFETLQKVKQNLRTQIQEGCLVLPSSIEPISFEESDVVYEICKKDGKKR